MSCQERKKGTFEILVYLRRGGGPAMLISRRTGKPVDSCRAMLRRQQKKSPAHLEREKEEKGDALG